MKTLISLIQATLRRMLGIPFPLPMNTRPRGIDNIWTFVVREAIVGDYLEFGVYKGQSFITAYTTAQRIARIERVRKIAKTESDLTDIRFFAFDSFAGLPHNDEDNRFWEGECACSMEQFVSNLRSAKVCMEKVEIVPGWYSETLTDMTKSKRGLSAAAVIYIDCDIYESTKQALNFVTSLINDGSVIIFNDWWCYKGRPDKGEQKGCNEWLDEHPNITLHEFIKWGYGDIAFIVQLERLVKK